MTHRYGIIEATGEISSDESRQFNVRLPVALHNALLAKAFSEGRPLTNYVRILLLCAVESTHDKKSR